MVTMLTHGTYLLDTDTCIELIKGNPNVVERVRKVGASECKISDVTGNTDHFERIPGLRIENWMERPE